MAIQVPISSSVQAINPSVLFSDGFELENSAIIPSENYSGSFTQGLNTVEFYVYNANSQLQYSDYNFSEYQIVENSTPGQAPYGLNATLADTTRQDALSPTNILSLNPESDVYNAGYSTGKLYGVYNFVNHELQSSNDSRYYIAEISGDRTEIRIKSNYLSDDDMKSSYVAFENTLDSVEFFDEFYITFGQNEYHIGINSQYVEGPDNVENDSSILIKLFDALPPKYKEFDELYVVTKTAETRVYEVEFEEDLSVIDNNIQLQGPNVNLSIKDFVNNSTVYQNKNELLGTESSGSKDQLLNKLDQKGIALTPNYSTSSFEDFVNFSSAKQRTQNFYEKVSRIQAYEADIAAINPVTGSNPTPQVSQSLASLYTKIEEEIKAFDGWDYYLYYNTASDSYPKDTSTGQIFPYPLLDTGSTTVLKWLGSDVENDQYYGGVLLSASLYDNNNQNWLYYTIPTFITEQNNNENYVEFCNMVGQSFDELWLYTKTVTAKLNTTNVLDEGVPLSLADDVITSLGYTGYGNNYNNQDNFIGLVGNDDGEFCPPTGSELINHYICINKGDIINYWQTEYSWEDYVEQLITQGFPYPIDKVSKEIFKRLYHNMSYLVKKKGTISGLRQLINIWGIPNTILRINEFGGKNKDQTDDYDLWYERYSYAYTPVANSFRASASAIIPWQPLYRNKIADDANIVPDGVAFRFKTTGYPSSSYAGSFNTQSLAVKKSNSTNDDQFDWGIILNYTGSQSGSYKGAGNSEYRDWAEMKFYISGAAADGGTAVSDPIYLPFFDGGWWSVLFQRNQHVDYTNNSNRVTYTLYAKNKIYNGNDGNSLGFEGSSSLDSFDVSQGGVYGTGIYGTALYGASISSSINNSWNTHSFSNRDGVYLGGRIEGAKVQNLVCNEAGQAFSGSFQEFRYYSNDISESVFNDFVMNPESIEGNFITASESSFDIINFRAPLGNELEHLFTSSYAVTLSAYNEYITSSHPAITASAPELITGSFYNPSNGEVSSSYHIRYEENTVIRTFSKTNRETYFLDQPSIGYRNRISNKIKNYEDLNFGNILSGLVSIEKNPFISQSYTENLNQLEVAFSPQDEVNDDIIQSLGYGAIQEIIADPRFRSSSDDYYPGLRDIADDYFKKYTKRDVFDYMRLIKYFDDSLFKAIKNYVPARTSVSTGIVIKQNMLERNRYREPQVNSFTTQSYAITNIPLTTQNLELTGSVEMYELTGSAGGSVNKYNVSSSQFGYYTLETTGTFTVAAGGYKIVNSAASSVSAPNQNPTEIYGDLYAEKLNDLFGLTPFDDPPPSGYLRSIRPVKSFFSLQVQSNAATEIALAISSSKRGEIYKSDPFTPNSSVQTFTTPLLDILPEEALAYTIQNVGNTLSTINVQYAGMKTLDLLDPNIGAGSDNCDISSSGDFSKQGYIEYNQTEVGLLGEAVTNQEAFYDGEFSGSIFDAQVRDNQYNPFKKVQPNSVVPWIFPTTNFTIATTQVNNRLKKSTDALLSSLVTQNTPTQAGTFTNVPITITSGAGTGTLLATCTYSIVGGLTSITITNNLATGIEAGDQLTIATNAAGLNGSRIFTVQQSALTSFSNITSTGFDCDNLDNDFFIFLSGQPANLINQKAYNISFDITNDASTGNAGIGLSQVASIGNQQMLFADVNINAKGNGPFSASFTTAFVPNGSSTLKARVSAQPGFKGTISNFNIAPNYAADSSWSEIVSDVYLNPLQQDQWQIENTQSIIFENSDYNPLNNNVNINRSSSTRLLLSYNDEQYQPEEFDAIVTYSLDNTSQSIFADIPDSNYTKFSSINPRYNGSELQSLDYNNFTPSGTIGVPQNLPVQPFNRKLNTKVGRVSIASSSVATAFLDGNSQSMETGLNAWEGDNSYGKTAVVSKFPRYIAHFQDSFEQYNKWNTQQFNIDSLIEIPSESIVGRTTVPSPILVDGSNEKIKDVAATFEPKRKVAVSYDSLQTAKLDFSQQKSKDGLGKLYTLGGGGVQFLTLNGNEQTRRRSAVSYSYDLGGSLTGSVQSATASQVVTSSTNVNIETNINPGSGYTVGSYSTTTSGGGINMEVIITEVDANGKVVAFTSGWDKDLSGTGYAVGDVVNATGGNNDFQFTCGLRRETGFLLSGSSTQLLFSRIVSPTKQADTLYGYLEITGPQLPLFHTYNMGVAEQKIASSAGVCYVDPAVSAYTGDKAFFVNEGIDPSDPESYYKWSPSGSLMSAYQDSQTPFLIQRGDVLRVEGFAESRSLSVTSSRTFKEDYTIMDVIDYHYSSSGEFTSLEVGNFSIVEDDYGVQRRRGGKIYKDLDAANPTTLEGTALTTPGTFGTMTAAIGANGAVGTFTSDGTNITEAFISVSGSTGPLTSSPLYAVGETHSVDLSAIGGSATQDVVINVRSMKNRIDTSTGVSVNVSDTGSDNPYAICEIDYCGKGSSLPVCRANGIYAMEWPTFLVTDRDPRPELNGLDKGAITRFTIRRQIQNDGVVSVDNIEPAPLIPTQISGSYTGVLRLGSTISTAFLESNTTTGIIDPGTYILDIKPGFTDGNGLGGRVSIQVAAGSVTGGSGISFSDVSESTGYQPGDKFTITATDIGNGGSGQIVFYLSTKNILPSRPNRTVGANAVSSQGFLIPDDLSEIQKENALSIINSMRSQNAFPTVQQQNPVIGPNAPFSGIPEDTDYTALE